MCKGKIIEAICTSVKPQPQTVRVKTWRWDFGVAMFWGHGDLDVAPAQDKVNFPVMALPAGHTGIE